MPGKPRVHGINPGRGTERDALCSGKRQLLRQKSEARQLKLKIAKESAPKGKEDACSNGIDWGMGPEDQEEEVSNGRFTQLTASL